MSLIIPWLPFWAFVAVAAVSATFLFWRACRHDLVDSEVAFDLVVVGVVSSLIFARLVEFVVNYQEFDWSLTKLFFFNVYSGFDFYGALLGLFLGISVVARAKKLNVLSILDLVAAPLAFLQGIVAVGKYITSQSPDKFVWFFYAFGFLVIFWILKRLGTQKRHAGFFVCFYLLAFALLDVLFWWREDVLFVKNIPYQLVAPLVIAQATLIFWYIVAGRNLAKDLKNFFAYFLLSILRFRRMVADANEAGKFSRSLILAPAWFAREVGKLLKLGVREIFLGIVDFLRVLGVRR